MRCATCASSCSATSEAFGSAPDEMPVFGTIAARFNDDGVTALYQASRLSSPANGLTLEPGQLPPVNERVVLARARRSCRRARARYLAEIADTVRGYHQHAPTSRSRVARERQQLLESQRRRMTRQRVPGATYCRSSMR